MIAGEKFTAVLTIIRSEMIRVFRVWRQTLLPPAITTVLYFVIFGNVIGPRIGTMQGHPYIQFIAPGLIMMQIITSAYSATVSSFYIAKFHGNIEEMLVSPMDNVLILLGYISGGVLRGILVGIIVTCIALFFTHLHIHAVFSLIFSTLLACGIFSVAGVINAVFAKTFDDISIIPTFVLTPLTYFGGVFYSISLLPNIWKNLSYLNPILYMVNTFRYGFLNLVDSSIYLSFALMLGVFLVLFALALWIFHKGIGLRY